MVIVIDIMTIILTVVNNYFQVYIALKENKGEKMGMLMFLIGVVLAIAIAIASLSKGLSKKKSTEQATYYSKIPLTEKEQQAYWLIRKACGEEKIVLAQVAFSSFIRTQGDKKTSTSLWNQMRQKVADFVICNKDFSIHCIIEIDDNTHNVKKDELRDVATKNAGIKTLRYKAINLPSADELKEAIK